MARVSTDAEVIFELLHFNTRVLPLCLAAAGLLSAQTVRFDTTLGAIDVVLTPDVTPLTVANFMAYVNNGHYNKTIIHRSLNATNYVSAVFYLVQGGGYVLGAGNLPALCGSALAPSTFVCAPPVTNEFKASNVRGTIAMAQYGGDINSATDEWYFNTSDNSGSLDSQNFVVFGKVANSAGLAVMDAINNLPTYAYNAGQEANFANLPLQNYASGLIRPANYIFVNSIAPIKPVTSASGVQDAASFASTSSVGIAPGEFITLYGTQLGPTSVATLTVNGSNLVDTILQGTQVTFNGVPGPMIFTSTGQIATIAPFGISNSSTVNVVVSYLGIQTASMQFKVVAANPAVFYNVDGSGNKNAAIVRVDGTVITAASPASVGDVLELYGEGYGIANPSLADGGVVAGAYNIPVTLMIDGQPVPTLYTGAAGGEVNGVLQINFAVPAGTKPGAHQIQYKLGINGPISQSGITLTTN